MKTFLFLKNLWHPDTPHGQARREIVSAFVTLKIGLDSELIFDYPKHLPIPRIGEFVSFDSYSGYVVSVSHTTVTVEKNKFVSCVSIVIVP